MLPGWYRATKNWDLLQLRNSRLVTAVELKSMSGSVGNNSNNRTEEAIGLAHDFWIAYQNGLCGERAKEDGGTAARRPWTGFIYILGHEEALYQPMTRSGARFELDEPFRGASRIERFKVLGRRMMQTGLFTQVALLVVRTDGTFEEPATDLSFSAFARALYRNARP